jgi:hypothetical protein
MAENNSSQSQAVTFITEDIPPSESFIVSSVSLRKSFIIRKKAEAIVDFINTNPGYTKEDVDKFIEDTDGIWTKEAEIKYPSEGDYLVYVLDPVTKDPIPIGETVEFIGGIREVPGGRECKEYLFDGTGLDPEDEVEYSYINCFNTEENVTELVRLLDGEKICALEMPVTNIGVFTEEGLCESIEE